MSGALIRAIDRKIDTTPLPRGHRRQRRPRRACAGEDPAAAGGETGQGAGRSGQGHRPRVNDEAEDVPVSAITALLRRGRLVGLLMRHQMHDAMTAVVATNFARAGVRVVGPFGSIWGVQEC